MPCDTISRARKAQLDRERQIKALEDQLKNKSARIAKIGNTINIEGWQERGGWCDECAIRKLRQSGDFQTRRMIADAVPQQSGIKFGHGH